MGFLREDQAWLVFGATYHGSPECAAYGYWIMHIDSHGSVRVGEPAGGCLASADYVEVEWQPLRVRVRPYVGVHGLQLGPRWVTVPWR